MELGSLSVALGALVSPVLLPRYKYARPLPLAAVLVVVEAS